MIGGGVGELLEKGKRKQKYKDIVHILCLLPKRKGRKEFWMLGKALFKI